MGAFGEMLRQHWGPGISNERPTPIKSPTKNPNNVNKVQIGPRLSVTVAEDGSMLIEGTFQNALALPRPMVQKMFDTWLFEVQGDKLSTAVSELESQPQSTGGELKALQNVLNHSIKKHGQTNPSHFNG